MGIRLYREPALENPVLIACWPGIGSIGIMAVDTLRRTAKAEELGEIEPWDSFYPKSVLIRNGESEDMEFPASKFCFRKSSPRDLMIFVGEEQPGEVGSGYA